MQNGKEEFRIDGTTLLKYEGNAEELKIPAYVRRIAPYAFHGCKSLVTVVMPSKLESIGKGAFYGCDNLQQAVLPGRLFRRAKGSNVFDDPERIYFRFFASQGGAEGDDADYSDEFGSEEEYLNALKEGEKAQAPQAAQPVSEDYAVKERPVRRELYAGTDVADDGYNPSLAEKIQAVVPAESGEKEFSDSRQRALVNDRNYLVEGDLLVRYIGAAKKTTVPDYITRIGENAFSNSGVTDVTLPAGLKIIGKGAFAWCDRLEAVSLPSGLEIIEDSAFSDCTSLTSLSIPACVKFIGANAFHACSGIKTILISPNSAISVISRRAFDFCVSLQKIALPSSVEIIEDGAFAHCEGLYKIILPDSLKEIGSWAFSDCHELREINFPDGLIKIGDVAFLNCVSLIAFDLPSTVEELGRQAFSGCTGLHVATLPDSLRPVVRPNKVFHGSKDVSVEYFTAEEDL